MSEFTYETFLGRSEVSFAEAAKNAVETAEREKRLALQKGESKTLRVVELSVVVEGPIGEYRVVLSP